jgi:hypothetical protein
LYDGKEGAEHLAQTAVSIDAAGDSLKAKDVAKYTEEIEYVEKLKSQP